MKILSLYKVEFGYPDGISSGNYFIISGNNRSPMLILAQSHEAAIQKAHDYYEDNNKKESVVDEWGSIRPQIDELKIKSVTLISDKVYF